MSTTAVTEKGIILDAMRVRAALDGRLTQIRVRVKPQPVIGMMFDKLNCQFYDNGNCDGATVHDPINCPYSIGTRLWVREKHYASPGNRCRYFASPDVLMVDGKLERAITDPPRKWRSSASMPRAFSRLTLEVKAVRVERVNEISTKDAIASGLRGDPHEGFSAGDGFPYRCIAKDAFEDFYDSLHGPGSFAAGHWVWVLEVERK